MFLLRCASVLGSMVVLAACSSPSQEWSKAAAENTISGYGAFLADYPHDPHAVDAENDIAMLQDEADWNRAQVASSIAGYQQYLRAEPKGAHVESARENVTARERADRWAALQKNITAATLQDFLAKYSSGPEADEARAKWQLLAGYRAQLATAGDRCAANRERAQIARRFAGMLKHVVVLPPDSQDPAYSVASAPMSEEQATDLCDSIGARGRECQVVPSRMNSAVG